LSPDAGTTRSDVSVRTFGAAGSETPCSGRLDLAFQPPKVRAQVRRCLVAIFAISFERLEDHLVEAPEYRA
jgi:hypothetical protein